MVELNRLTSGNASFDADQNRISNLVIFQKSKIKLHMTINLRLFYRVVIFFHYEGKTFS